jgi:hypothetical protein
MISRDGGATTTMAAAAARPSMVAPASRYVTPPSVSSRVATNAAMASADQSTTTAHGSTWNGIV